MAYFIQHVFLPNSLDRVAKFTRANGDVFGSEYDMLVGADGVNSGVRQVLEEIVQDFTVRQLEVKQC